MGHGSDRHVGQYLILDSRDNGTSVTRLGITVTRRYGDAHERNRFKRLVREAFRLNYSKFPSGRDFNVKPRTLAKTASMENIQADLILLANPTK